MLRTCSDAEKILVDVVLWGDWPEVDDSTEIELHHAKVNAERGCVELDGVRGASWMKVLGTKTVDTAGADFLTWTPYVRKRSTVDDTGVTASASRSVRARRR